MTEPEDVDVSGADELDDELTDEGDLAELEDGQLAYDCAAWAGETRRLLKSLLVTNGIAHAWQGTTLTVREEDEATVDDLIDEVALTARPALDPEAPKVVYEVSGWSAAMQTQFADALTLADVAYEWDERGDLVVLEDDEEAVSVVLDDLPDPDESMISSDDGVAVHEVLDAVFMSTDRLARNGDDAAGTVALVDAAGVIEQLALPFGFEPAQWRTLVAKVQALRDALDGTSDEATDDESADVPEPPSDAAIAAMAGDLRLLVRQYI